MIAAPGITINGIKITPEQINAEVQYHPAESLSGAKYEAMQALVIRELLLQRAVAAGVCSSEDAVKRPDAIIDDLLSKEIIVPDPDAEACRRYYKNNRKRFVTSPLFEASHILYIAPPDDAKARERALHRAQKALLRVKKNPESFVSIAKKESACSSASQGGRLGQIGKGQTLPAFEATLFSMQEGQISEKPIPTEVGYHILKVHNRVEGRQLPYDAVSDWIAEFLRTQSWQRAFSQYIQILAGEAEINGFQMRRSDNPLVQ